MAAAPSHLEAQFSRELTCSICLELFTRPKVLPCQHTFCQDCLQDHARRGGAFKCPVCRQQVWLPPQEVAGLPDNLMAASLTERLQRQTISGDLGGPTLNDQTLITKGKEILGTYTAFVQGLREQEETLKTQKQQITNSINKAYNQMLQSLRERKEHLLADAEKQHRKNIKLVQDRMTSASADVNELSAACNQAEQQMKHGMVKSPGEETTLSQVIRKYRGKAAPTPVQTPPVVFQPIDSPVPVLGHVMVQSLPSAPIPAAPVRVTEATAPCYGYQSQSESQEGRVKISGSGHRGQGMFEHPSGIAVSEEGKIFVTDRSSRYNRIQVFTLQGTFVREIPTVVSGEQMMDPHDVATDGDGNLWVVGKLPNASYQYYRSETARKKKDKPCTEFAVQYDNQGKVLRKFDLQQTPHDRAIAVDTRRNHILITQTETCNSRKHGTIQVFTPEKKIRTVGQHQVMVYPQQITVDWEGNILVSDYNGHAIYVYNSKGEFLCRFGVEGRGEGQLYNPRGICTDRAGNIIVANTGNHCVEMFDRKGNFLKHITNVRDIRDIHAVAMAPQGQLVIATKWPSTVIIFYK